MIIQEKKSLAPLTSFGIGGPARYFVEAFTREELKEALLFAKERYLPYFILGSGTNVLISDRGFPGIVIKPELHGLTVMERSIQAETGVTLMEIVDRAAAHGLAGMEPLAGIPGTIGGAIRGNAGAYGASVGDLVQSVQILEAESMEIHDYLREQCRFEYRGSIFKNKPNLIVVGVRFMLSQGSTEALQQKVAAILTQRNAKNLQDEKSCGSFFMNPTVADNLVKAFEADQKMACKNNKVPAGWFIDKLGLRGKRIGGAMVSEKHANYIINAGDATAEQIRTLVALIKEEVRKKMGVELQEEVNYVGF